MIENWVTLHFGLLVGQKKSFKDVTVGKLYPPIHTQFLLIVPAVLNPSIKIGSLSDELKGSYDFLRLIVTVAEERRIKTLYNNPMNLNIM